MMLQRYAPYALSLLIHAVLLTLLVVSLQQHTPRPQPVATQQQAEPIQAVAVDESKVLAEMDRLRNEERRQKQQEDSRRRQLQDDAERMKQAREREEQRLADLKQKTQEEQRRKEAQEQERKTRELAEQKRLTELKKEQDELAKKREVEQKRLDELESRRKMAEEKQRKAETEQKKREAQEALKKSMEEEAKRLAAEDRQRAAAQTRQQDKLRAQYILDIQNRVKRNWLRPAGVTQEFECRVLVQQMPTGDVISVQITKSCGSAVLDRSVENAVHKSSPLPPPPTPEIWEREIDVTFRSN